MTGLEDKYIIKNNKRLRYGYTTGSCAAGATRGAVRMLLSGASLSEVELQTPKGITLNLQLHDITRGETHVSVQSRKTRGTIPTPPTAFWSMQKSKRFPLKQRRTL